MHSYFETIGKYLLFTKYKHAHCSAEKNSVKILNK